MQRCRNFVYNLLLLPYTGTDLQGIWLVGYKNAAEMEWLCGERELGEKERERERERERVCVCGCVVVCVCVCVCVCVSE